MNALQYNALHKFSVIRNDSWYVIGCKFRYLHGILIEKYYNIYKGIGWDKIREQRFDRQKELGSWPSNMILPPGYHLMSARTASHRKKNYSAMVLAVHAAMKEQLDKNVGRMVAYCKLCFHL